MLSNHTACVIVRKQGLVFSELEAMLDLHGLPTGSECTWGGEDALLYTGVSFDPAEELEPYEELGYDAIYIDNEGTVHQLRGVMGQVCSRIGKVQCTQNPPQKPDDVIFAPNGNRFIIVRKV